MGVPRSHFSSPWGWMRFAPGDAWNLPSKGTGVGFFQLVSPAEGSVHWQWHILISCTHAWTWPDRTVCTTAPPSHTPLPPPPQKTHTVQRASTVRTLTLPCPPPLPPPSLPPSPNRLSWPLFTSSRWEAYFLCIIVLSFQRNRVQQICQRRVRHSLRVAPSGGVGSRCRRARAIVHAVTPTKHESGLSPLHRVVSYGSALGDRALLMSLLSHHQRARGEAFAVVPPLPDAWARCAHRNIHHSVRTCQFFQATPKTRASYEVSQRRPRNALCPPLPPLQVPLQFATIVAGSQFSLRSSCSHKR